MRHVVTAAVAAVLACAPAGAAIQSYSYTGTIAPGQTVSGYFAFDDAVPATYANPFQGGNYAGYEAVTFLSADGPGFSFRSSQVGRFDVVDNYRDGTRDGIGLLASGNVFVPGQSMTGHISLTLIDYTGTALNGAGLPPAIDLSAWTERTGSVSGAVGFGRNFTIDSIVRVDAIPGGVPEPATWAMMILGFGLAGAAARRSALRQAYAPISAR